MLRRHFLRRAGALAAGVALPASLLARSAPAALVPAPPRRIKGRVRLGGRGLGKVGVTDGFTTVVTEGNGRFTLLAHPRAKFVSVRLPAGCRVPTNPTGTARLYQPI